MGQDNTHEPAFGDSECVMKRQIRIDKWVECTAQEAMVMRAIRPQKLADVPPESPKRLE